MQNITTPIPEIPVIIEKPKTNYLTLILISLCFVLFITGVFYLGRQSVKNTINSTITPTATPVKVIPIPSANSISDWKTFTDSKNNYSIKYPPELKVENKDTGGIYINDFENAKPDCQGGGCFLGNYTIKLYIEPIAFNQSDLKKIVDEKYKNDLENLIISTNELGQVNFNGYLAYYYEATGEEKYSNYYIMSKSGTVFKIFYPNNDNNNLKLLDQILSTFKFIESKAEIPTTISTLFSSINSALKSNVPTTTENEFYSFAGNQVKKSWKIDLSKVINSKQQSTLVRDTLETKLNFKYTDSANGSAQNIDEFISQKTICYYMYGLNTTGGPETFSNASSYYYLSCSE